MSRFKRPTPVVLDWDFLIMCDRDHKTALLLSTLASVASGPDGWYAMTQKTIQALTGLSRHEYDRARSALEEFGMIEVCRRGVPATTCFKVLFVHLDAIAFQMADKLEKASAWRAAALGMQHVGNEQIAGFRQTGLPETGNSGTSQVVDSQSQTVENQQIAGLGHGNIPYCRSFMSQTAGMKWVIDENEPVPQTQTPLSIDIRSTEDSKSTNRGKPVEQINPLFERKAFIDGFSLRFQRTFGSAYAFQGAKDGQAIKRLAKAAEHTQHALEMVDYCFAPTNRKKFLQTRARTIAGLASVWNDLTSERSTAIAIGASEPLPAEAYDEGDIEV